ncbi:armadillo-type protein [Lipomyces oligophaga]|uniref:armadillo-type protein n=1 Tax=Lipomyces oligophaga TaxID=45792 RepID=UPI0034CD6ED0
MSQLAVILDEIHSSEQNSDVHARAVIQLAGLLQNDSSGEIQKQLQQNVEQLIVADVKSKLIKAISIMTLLFHIDDSIASRIFLDSSQSKAEELIRRDFDIELLERFLQLISACCVSKSCRTEVEQKYIKLIASSLQEEESTQNIQALAASILIKLTATPKPNLTDDTAQEFEQLRKDIEVLSNILREIAVVGDADSRANALEGLTYSSLNPTVKETLINDKKFVTTLLSIMKHESKNYSIIFAILTILSNLTSYPEILTKEAEQLAKLRRYANNGKNQDIEEDKMQITRRCKKLLDLKILESISACMSSASPNSRRTIGKLMKGLATERAHRSGIVQQGGISILLSILQPSGSASSAENFRVTQDERPNQFAISALARILITVNPTLAFSGRTSPVAAVPPLLLQLDDTTEENTNLDIFEALLALTNLASMGNENISKLIAQRGWSQVETLMLSNNSMVQRASVELVCNLSGSPEVAAKYLDPDDKDQKNRLRILIALADVEDLATRCAAAGTLATLSEWTPASEILLEDERNLRAILRILHDEDSGVIFRGAVCIRNLIQSPTTKTLISRIRSAGGIDSFNAAGSKALEPEMQTFILESKKLLESNL